MLTGVGVNPTKASIVLGTAEMALELPKLGQVADHVLVVAIELRVASCCGTSTTSSISAI